MERFERRFRGAGRFPRRWLSRHTPWIFADVLQGRYQEIWARAASVQRRRESLTCKSAPGTCRDAISMGSLYAGEIRFGGPFGEARIVTVYDRSIDPARVVLANERINGFASVPIHLPGDGTGRAELSWTAASVDSLTPKCGHADEVVSDGAAVTSTPIRAAAAPSAAGVPCRSVFRWRRNHAPPSRAGRCWGQDRH